MPHLKVITHDTSFHADEVIAVALLRYAGYDIDLIRTRNPTILATATADPEVAVLDVGGIYDPAMLNFDHHQDMELKSAAGLVYEHFKSQICPLDAQPYFERFISSIDVMDTNRDNIFEVWKTLPKGFRNTSGIIGGFNRDVTNATEQFGQFGIALDFATVIIDNEIYSAKKKAKSEADYASRVILSNNVAVFDEYSTVWKDKKEHTFVVLPHANGWQIQTIDTTVAKVPESVTECEGFIFRHGSGFMATIKNKEVAVAFAETL